VQVWAVTTDLAAGTRLTADVLAPVNVGLGATASRYLARSASPVGRTLSRNLTKGELLPRSALAAGPPVGNLVAIPVSPQHVTPGLNTGQRIDVYATTGSTGTAGAGSPARTSRVLAGVAVQQVQTPGEGALTGAGQVLVTVRLQDNDALTMVAAIRDAEIDIVAVPLDRAQQPATAPIPTQAAPPAPTQPANPPVETLPPRDLPTSPTPSTGPSTAPTASRTTSSPKTPLKPAARGRASGRTPQ
jgi:hypothetical protein